MKFKGHFAPLTPPLDFNKLIIYSKSEGKKHIQKEYFYNDGKVLKIIDHNNGIISNYNYLEDDSYEVKFYLFQDSLEDKEFNSIKQFTLRNGQQVKEVLINIEDNEEVKIYIGEFEYDGDDLLFEKYTYANGDVYRIKHEWSKDRLKKDIIHLDESNKVKYTLDKKGFVKECLFFKYEGSVKKTLYEYIDNKLFKLIEFPHLKYKKTLFMNETEHYYFENGLLEKEVVKDYETKEVVTITYYDYEK